MAVLAFDGSSALRHTQRAVAFGARPPGSSSLAQLQGYITTQLKAAGCQVELEAFTANTPAGPVGMKNLLCRLKGTAPGARALVVSGHYDTKPMPGRNFVGANDGGSSTGFLLELARVAARTPRKRDLWIVFFDGEEAFAQWNATDSLYGSRHQATKWASTGFLARIDALINVDMIGDRDLNLLRDVNSSPELVNLIWRVAADLGVKQHFEDAQTAMEDDHMPFRRMGVNAIDLIDFEYGPLNRWWHTEQDTLDKLSAQSFTVVGRVVVEALRRLDAK